MLNSWNCNRPCAKLEATATAKQPDRSSVWFGFGFFSVHTTGPSNTILNGTNPLVIPGSAMLTKPAGSDTPGPSTSENGSSQGIKQEDLSNMFDKFAQKIISAMTNKNTTPEVASAIRNFLCNFCGREGHFLGNCKIVEEYIQEGKCRKNSEGRIVLPTGAFLPKAIIGRFMKERFDE